MLNGELFVFGGSGSQIQQVMFLDEKQSSLTVRFRSVKFSIVH